FCFTVLGSAGRSTEVGAKLQFAERLAVTEMAARSSLPRTMRKLQSATKPVAIITAFQGGSIRDATGRKITDPAARLAHNRRTNATLIQDLKKRGLSFY